MIIDEKFWLAVCFIIFVSLTYKLVKRSIINLIDNKIADVAAKVIEASELRATAIELLEQINSKLQLQKCENQQLLDDAKVNVRNTLEHKKTLIELELQNKIAEATKKIEQRKDLALIDLHKNFTTIAHQIAKDYIVDHVEQLDSDVNIARKFIN